MKDSSKALNLPDFDIPDYDGLEIERPTRDVSDDDVDAYRKRFLEQYGSHEDHDGAAEAGDFVTLAEALRDLGMRTGAFVNNAHLPAEHGMAQGFDVYEQGDLDAEAINRNFLRFVEEGGDQPFFAYLHYLDVHWPFEPEPPFDKRFAHAEAPAFPGTPAKLSAF